MSDTIRPTNVPGLDALLTGGIEPGSLMFVVGPPGAGKTVLCSQIIFAAAQQGTPVVIFSSYSEPQAKLMQHLRRFAFFDESLLGNRIMLRTLPELDAMETAKLATTLVRMIRECGAKLALIDGLQSLEPILDNADSLRRLLGSVSTQLPYADTTMLVTLTGDARSPTSRGALTTADTILGLTYQLVDTRHLRTIEVVKQRGRALLPGRHSYHIDGQGFTIFPRIEVYPTPNTPQPLAGRTPFGLTELDNVLQGGLPAGSATVLAGAPGTGKTTLALYWALQQATPEAPTLFVTFREYAPQLAQKATAFDLDLQAAVATGAVHLLRFDPVELNVDEVGVQLVAALAINPARVILDDLGPLIRELGPRLHDYMVALMAHLYGANVTSLFTFEIAPFVGFCLDLGVTPMTTIGENVLILQQQEKAGRLQRVLAVLRMRLSGYDPTLRELVITPQGLRVLSPAESLPHVFDHTVGEPGPSPDPSA